MIEKELTIELNKVKKNSKDISERRVICMESAEMIRNINMITGGDVEHNFNEDI